MTDRGRLALSPLGGGCWLASILGYVLSLLTGDGWLLAVTAMAFTLPLVDLAFAVRAGSVSLTFADQGVVGRPLRVVAQRTGRPLVEADLAVTLFPPSERMTTRLPMGCDSAAIGFAPVRRGLLPPVRWMVDSYGPLGLAARRRHGIHGGGIAWPAWSPPSTSPLQHALAGEAAPQESRGPEPSGVRTYQVGDTPRMVHWRSTARRGEPVVRDGVSQSGAGLVIATGLLGPAQETALSHVAWTAARAARDGVEVTIVSGREVRRPTTAPEVLEVFALLDSVTPSLDLLPRRDGAALWWLASTPPPPGAVWAEGPTAPALPGGGTGSPGPGRGRRFARASDTGGTTG